MTGRMNISKVQRAFFPNGGIHENLTVIDAVIHDARKRLRELRLASLDLKKAFDSVSHDAILTTLRSRGYPLHLIKYVEMLYASCTTIVSYDTSSRTITPTRGVRQGDPLSPLMFNLVMDDLLRLLERENIGHPTNNSEMRLLGTAFADDLILLAPSKATLQHLVDISAPFLEQRGLIINAEKSFTMSLVPSVLRKRSKL